MKQYDREYSRVSGRWIILAIIFISLFSLWISVQCSVAGQKTDIPHESAPTDPLKLKKITCLYIIREDYNGLNLSYPSRLFFDSVKKEIYITDSGHNRILVYTYDFYPLLCIDKSDGIESPMGLAVDPEGYIFVAQSSGSKQKRARISVLTPSLRWKKDIFFEGFENSDGFSPKNIALSKVGRIYVAGSSFYGVVVLNKNGAFSHLLSPVDRLGKGEEQKATICDVEIDASGRIYLLSEDMGRIYVYDDKENFLFKFGQKGGGSGKLSRPRGITLDDRNRMIYVIDYMRHTANAYSENGRFLFGFGGKGWGKGWFQYPSDIITDDSGNVLVADTFNQRVQVLKPELIPSVAMAEKVKPKDIITKELVKETKPEAPVKEKLAEQMTAQYYILTANMNLREKSATNSRIIRFMKKGEEFEILGQDKHDELTSWYLIKTGSGRTGWLCGIYRGKLMFVEKKRKRIPAVATLKLKVLSGDGDLNSAKRMAKKLGNMGYKIRLIDRAPQSNFLRNTVYFALGFQDEAKRLVSSLGDNTILKPLSWFSIFDIIVVTGKNGQTNFMEKQRK